MYASPKKCDKYFLGKLCRLGCVARQSLEGIRLLSSISFHVEPLLFRPPSLLHTAYLSLSLFPLFLSPHLPSVSFCSLRRASPSSFLSCRRYDELFMKGSQEQVKSTTLEKLGANGARSRYLIHGRAYIRLIASRPARKKQLISSDSRWRGGGGVAIGIA